MAHHYQHSDNLDKAVDYLGRAGDQAAARSASVEIVEAYLEAALGMLQQLPETAERDDKELQIQLDLAGYLNNRSFGDPGRERALNRARTLSEQSGNFDQLLRVLWQLCQYHIQVADIRAASGLAEQAFDLAKNSTRPDLIAGAIYNRGETALWRGNVTEALKHIEKLNNLFEASSSVDYRTVYGVDLRMIEEVVRSIAEVIAGSPDRGARRIRKIIERTRTAGDTYGHSIASLVGSTIIHWLLQDWPTVRSTIEIGTTQAVEYGFRETEGIGRGIAALMRATEGDSANALMDWKIVQSDLESIGSFILARGFANMAAEVYRKTTSEAEALQFIDSCLEQLDHTSANLPEAELCRIKGEILGCVSPANLLESERWLAARHFNLKRARRPMVSIARDY